jgi:Fe/S biogenesis protein NfuA
MNMVNVDVTPSAQEYLAGLLKKQDAEGVSVRMFVLNPGTPEAETCLSYCRPGEVQQDDLQMEFDAFRLYLENRSAKFLDEAKVDYTTDKMGGQLTIRAPNSRVPKVSDDSPIEDKVNYVLWNEINPGLASHGGQVSLVEVTEDQHAILRFGGGCQGCSMLNVTLRDGVEKTLLEKLPELKGVRDVTDHTDTSNAYYS